jgi:hypothetical protein
MVATMLGNCCLSAAAVYLIADVGERQQVAGSGRRVSNAKPGKSPMPSEFKLLAAAG